MAPHRYDGRIDNLDPRELIEFISEHEASEPIPTLEGVGVLQRWLSEVEDVAVMKARVEGAPWSVIGEALGRSKQAAWEKHREDGAAWLVRKHILLARVGALVEELGPFTWVNDGRRPEKQHQAEWARGTALLRQALTAFPPDSLPQCWHLAQEVGRKIDEANTFGEARREVTEALAALAVETEPPSARRVITELAQRRMRADEVLRDLDFDPNAPPIIQ